MSAAVTQLGYTATPVATSGHLREPAIHVDSKPAG